MRKITSYLVCMLVAICCFFNAFAQNITISGNVTNGTTGEQSSAVSVTVVGGDAGTYTDDKGNFSLSVKSLPVTLMFSSIGFTPKEVTFTSASNVMNVQLEPSNKLGQEVVVSASRVPQKILKSPVTVERVNAAAIRNTPAANFYDIVATLKGVDITTSSLTFKSPTTRGFAGSGNVRFNQYVDGMDNQAPGLNFSVGSIIGLNELDIDNIELLSGASSALYGSGGLNGTMLMTSKNPFKYQGLSYVAKAGMLHTDGRDRPISPYYNFSVRWAKKVSEKFAFKVVSELIQARDWIGTDYRDYDRLALKLRPGTRQTDPNYDGVNVYGDETSADIRAVLNGAAQALPFLAPFIATLTTQPILVSRTGYTERELISPNTTNFKLGGSANYKLTQRTELSAAAYWGTGTTIYTGASRYSIQDFKMGQYKIELLNPKYMFRAYTTQENAGNTYNLAATTQIFNEVWKPSAGSNGWYAQYGQAYLNAKLGGATDQNAHTAARSIADIGRPLSGTQSFKNTYDSVSRKPVPNGGGLLDRTDLYNVEGNYNISDLIGNDISLLIGGNYRRFVLNSQGTLFADSVKPISINEVGAFLQASKTFGPLTLTASGRYDKNENFEGRFTPRATAVYEVAENNNIRLSYQQAYRFPSTQQQFINLPVGAYTLIGGDKTFADLYNFDTNPIYNRDSLRAGKIAQQPLPVFRPESLTSYELGYKGLLMESKLLIDAYGYYGNYQNFLARTFVVQARNPGNPQLSDSTAGKTFSIPINSPSKIKTYGFGIGIDYRLPLNFTFGGNFASDNLTDVPTGLVASFNSPKYKANLSLGNTGFGKDKRLGFLFAYRWQDSFFFQGDLATGQVPQVQTVDGQFSYKLPKTKSMLKLGATNLLNQYYYNAIGNSHVGGLYYLSYGYNIY